MFKYQWRERHLVNKLRFIKSNQKGYPDHITNKTSLASGVEWIQEGGEDKKVRSSVLSDLSWSNMLPSRWTSRNWRAAVGRISFLQ